MKGFFSRCDQSRSFLRMCPHLLKKYLKENFICCAEKGIKGMQFSSLNNCSVTTYTAFFISFGKTSLYQARGCNSFFRRIYPYLPLIFWVESEDHFNNFLKIFLQFELSKHYLLFRSSHPEVFCKKKYS